MTTLVITEYPADHVARIVINRPGKLNPLSCKMILELAAEFERPATDGDLPWQYFRRRLPILGAWVLREMKGYLR